jgi:hypothetical protein
LVESKSAGQQLRGAGAPGLAVRRLKWFSRLKGCPARPSGLAHEHHALQAVVMRDHLGGLGQARLCVRGLLRPRCLLPQERSFLECEFGHSLDLNRLRIAGGGHPLGRVAWQPMAAIIQLADACFESSQPLRELRCAAYPILAHEALHVWQRVHRHCRLHVSVDGLWLGMTRGAKAYQYDRQLSEPSAVLREFLAGNIEQQGQIFEDYVRSNIATHAARDPRFSEVARYVRDRSPTSPGVLG